VAPLTEDELNNNDIYNYKTGSRATNSTSADTTDEITISKRSSRGGLSIVDATLGLENVQKKKNYALEKDDSIEELVKAIKAPRKRVEIGNFMILLSNITLL